ncbi:MAG: heme exporter protein CcmD [Betaproteobacteria bacterium]|nr:heme exporter protein CcmD [Betaproteobacteria bacterium]
MQWGSVGEFFSMGGYAEYVWGAFGVTLVLMVGEVVVLGRRHAAALRDARRLARAGGPR